MDSENLRSLIRLSVSDGQKTDSSKVVSVIVKSTTTPDPGKPNYSDQLKV